MPFPADERAMLLTVKGVGPTVVDRLEQIGIDTLAALAASKPEDIVAQVAAMLGTTCWRNSPQARGAIAAAVATARAASSSGSADKAAR